MLLYVPVDCEDIWTHCLSLTELSQVKQKDVRVQECKQFDIWVNYQAISKWKVSQ